MAYEELKKLYYKNQDEYNAEYIHRFNSDDSVHIDFMVGNKPAFFVETADILRLALKITQLDQKIARLSNSLPGIAKAQYSKRCLIDEIVLTNNIEGVHSSRKEIGEALDILERQSKEKHKYTRFLGLVNKYLKLMNAETIPLESCQDVRTLYDEVFLEEVMEEDPQNKPDGAIFRKGSESIYNAAGKAIHQGVYPEDKIIQCMEQALNFLNSNKTEQLFQICIFHYLFEYIHPFYDGNGRMGRLILSYCISKTLQPLLAYHISATIKENIKQYYKAFEICNDPHNLADLTPFLLMQLEMIYKSMLDLQQTLEEKQTQMNRYQSMFSSMDLNEFSLYSVLIQAALFSEEGISQKDLMGLMDIKSYSTFKKKIDKIPQALLVSHVKGKGHAKYYELNLGLLDDILLSQGTDKQINDHF